MATLEEIEKRLEHLEKMKPAKENVKVSKALDEKYSVSKCMNCWQFGIEENRLQIYSNGYMCICGARTIFAE